MLYIKIWPSFLTNQTYILRCSTRLIWPLVFLHSLPTKRSLVIRCALRHSWPFFVFNQDNSTVPKPSITVHLGILNCRFWKPQLKLIRQYSASQIRLIVQSFVYFIFDILKCNYSWMNNTAGTTKRRKIQATSMLRLRANCYKLLTIDFNQLS